MLFEADVMGCGTPGRIHSPKYASSSNDQDGKHIVSDAEINKMLALIFGVIILWIGVLVGIGFAIKKSDEKNTDDNLNDDIGIASFLSSSGSEINENVSDNSVVPLTLLACVLAGLALMHFYQNLKTNTPIKPRLKPR